MEDPSGAFYEGFFLSGLKHGMVCTYVCTHNSNECYNYSLLPTLLFFADELFIVFSFN